MFIKLNKMKITTTYPLLLNFYKYYDDTKISKYDFVNLLQILENYLIRGFICRIPTNSLSKVFPSIFKLILSKHSYNIIEGFKTILQEKNYPKDNDFLVGFQETKFYGSPERKAKTKLILESIESSYQHKELASFGNYPFNFLFIKNRMNPRNYDSYEFIININWLLIR